MGIDLLDLVFRIERQFNIKVHRDELAKLFLAADPQGNRRDLRVRDLHVWVEEQTRRQNPEYQGHLESELNLVISQCLYVKLASVTPDAWMVRDLGMD